MNRLIRALLALGVLLGFSLVLAPQATAHVPSGSASCSGAVVSVASYAHPVTIHVDVADGGSETKTVTGAGSVTAAVPQDGEVHGWSGYAHGTEGEASQEYGGTVGPCGEKASPPPAPTPAPPTATPTVPTETPVPAPPTATPTPTPPTHTLAPPPVKPPSTPRPPHHHAPKPPHAVRPPAPPAPKPPVQTGLTAQRLPNTGTNENLAAIGGVGIALMLGGGFMLYRRRLG